MVIINMVAYDVSYWNETCSQARKLYTFTIIKKVAVFTLFIGALISKEYLHKSAIHYCEQP